MSSFKSNENIHKKEDGPYYVVSAKSMETLSCHSNQIAYATASFVEPNAMNFSAKFQLHPPGVDLLIYIYIYIYI